MAERDVITMVDQPSTISSLVAELRHVGLDAGMTVMVHSSLSSLGYVAGGAHAVVTALLEVLGPSGTLMMPTHSTDLSDPGSWSNPPIPAAWVDPVRNEIPAYDPALTPTRSMGAIVECFRHVPGVLRSAHPAVSASAVGPNASDLIDGHQLDHALGESSPQARLYDLDGMILLLGVTHANNTSLHLAEYRSAPEDAAEVTQHSPMLIDGARAWVSYASLDDDVSDFEQVGDAFAMNGAERNGPIGAGTARLMSARTLVDFAADWFRVHRWTTD
jgi:aminoglycoside 3-N-acetyltransferase